MCEPSIVFDLANQVCRPQITPRLNGAAMVEHNRICGRLSPSMNIQSLQEAGLQARKSGDAIVVRNPKATLAFQRDSWWRVDPPMQAEMNRLGIVEGYQLYTWTCVARTR
jgi:hypothetical protein